jgi:hypothetical protein
MIAVSGSVRCDLLPIRSVIEANILQSVRTLRSPSWLVFGSAIYFEAIDISMFSPSGVMMMILDLEERLGGAGSDQIAHNIIVLDFSRMILSVVLCGLPDRPCALRGRIDPELNR